MFLKLINKPFKEQLSPWSLKTFRGQWTLVCETDLKPMSYLVKSSFNCKLLIQK